MKRRATRPVTRRGRKLGHEGTPELRAMLREKGFATGHERGVELWKMFKAVHDQMRAIALEIEYNETHEET